METILNNDSVKRVKKIISKFDSNINIVVLDNSTRTAKEAAFSLNCDVGAIIKSLVIKNKESFLICLVPGDKRCSFKKMKTILNKTDIRMANAQEVKENTGFSIGGVSPVGHSKKLDILIDKSLKRFENIYAAAGHPNCIFKINYNELIKITNGSVKDIIE